MEVIPVIDLKSGQVVHARAGNRRDYRPIRTPLSASAAPEDVVGGLLGLYPFARLYVADLDAIERRGDHDAELRRLGARFPALELWVDNGTDQSAAAAAWLERVPGRLVIGSESQRGPDVLAALWNQPPIALSLDFRGDVFLGPEALLDEPELWPSHVIVMSLALVGAQQGPDFARLDEISRRAAGRLIYAAGGVRDAADLRRLAALGCAGALVATALHSGTISRTDLESVARPLGPGGGTEAPG